MAITYGSPGQPAQSIINYDALFSTSLANNRKSLIDNVSTSNIIFYELAQKGLWEPADGGLYLTEDLMYALAPTDSYDGYDELALTPTEGITQAQFQWAQSASPVSISEKERKQNKHRIVNLIEAKIKQSEISIKEFFAKAFLQGELYNGGVGDIRNPFTSPINGSAFVNPLFRLVSYTPTISMEIGGINQATNDWWQNQQKASTATTGDGFLQEVLNLYNSCSKGTGGPPNVGWTDQITWELLSVAYYKRFRTETPQVGNYPFPVLKFHGASIAWDEYMPNVAANNGAGALNATDMTDGKGTLVFVNTQFLKMRYESETNFVATDFERPINQDAKYKHILWMGQSTINNRRKHGVLGDIDRTLTFS